MSMKTRPATSGMPGARQGRGRGIGQGIDDVSRVAISNRIWVALGVLAMLFIFAGVGLFMARGELAGVKSALRQAEGRAKESELRLKDALDDKQQVIRELAAQGNRLAEFSREEEKARSALTAVSSDAEATQKLLADLKSRIAKSQRQVQALRKENAELATVKAEMAVLKGELNKARARLEQAETELQRLQSDAEPYRAGSQPARQ